MDGPSWLRILKRLAVGPGARGAVAALALFLACAVSAPAQDEPTAPRDIDRPVGFSVDGVIGSNQGGFRLPDGTVLTRRPRLLTSDPIDCTPPAGESRACQVGGAWDYCGLSLVAFANVNPFSQPSCRIDFGAGGWVVKARSAQSEQVNCAATCMRMEVR